MKNIIFLLMLCTISGSVLLAMEQHDIEQPANETTALLHPASSPVKSHDYKHCACCHRTIDNVADNYGKVCVCIGAIAVTATISGLYATGNCPIQ